MSERGASVTLTEDERMAISEAAARVWGVYAVRGVNDLSSVRNKVELAIERILTAHRDAAEAEIDRAKSDRDECEQLLMQVRASADEWWGRWEQADKRADAAEAERAALVERMEKVAAEMLAFDCLEDAVPYPVDVPDDYEHGVHDSGRRLRAALAASTERPA